MFSVILGCMSSPNGRETFKTEGFLVALPKPGTRVVVRGNHQKAVNQAIPWLNDHQLLVVNRMVNEDLTIPKTARGEQTELPSQVQDMARKVGATLVVFVQADESLVDRTDPLKNGHQQPSKMIGVEVQGIYVETGEMAFGAMAWNPQPLVQTEQTVQDLTVLALEQSWKEPDVSSSIQGERMARHAEEIQSKEMIAEEIRAEKIQPVEEASFMAPVPLESSGASHVGGPASVATSQDQVTVPAEHVPPERISDEKPFVPPVAKPSANETPVTKEDPSLGWQIASGALSILYTPFKLVYAGFGGLVGGFVYALTGGNEQAAQSVWDASLRGTYWLTPGHLQGTEPLRFKGEPAN
jgi:hypothetical protein